MNGSRKYFHVYTKGLENYIVFQDREDYIAGMNYVATTAFSCSVDMLAFTLMSNHFHFALYATEDEAKRFINLYKQVISAYVRRKYGISQILRYDQTSCKEIDLENEGLKKIIAYILNNPVKAGVNFLAQNYEWGSCRYYFSNIRFEDGVPVRSIGERRLREILHSKVKLSESYRLNSQGYIDPRSYLNIEFVEKLFKRASSMEYFLNIAGKSDKKDGPISFNDSTVCICLSEILEKQYDSVSVCQLPFSARQRIVIYLKSKLGCQAKQIARVTNLDLKDVFELLG